MNLKKYLTEKTITLSLRSETGDGILQEMVELLCGAGKLDPGYRETAFQALQRRERMMTTGLQDGIAIPHAKTEGVRGLVGAIGIKPEGIDFGALDGKPSRIFVVTLSSKGAPIPHVHFLAEVCRLLQEESMRQRLLEARSTREVLDILFP